MHLGRSWTGTRIEDECPCPKAPCGLINAETALPDCPEHAFWAAKTMRQGHPAEFCPADRAATGGESA